MKDQTLSSTNANTPAFSWLARTLGPHQDIIHLSDEVWKTVEPLLAPHRVTGLLYEAIQKGTVKASHPVQFDLAARLTRWSEATHDWSEFTLLALNELHRRKIPHLVLKGWALIPLVYNGNRELREVSDLDLLIPREHLAEADAALLAAGFAIPPQAEVWPGFAHKFSHEAQYVRRSKNRLPMGIDLHWQAMGNPHLWSLVGHDWFERAQESVLNGHPIRIPSTEDLFLHLCAHEMIDHARDPITLLFRRVDLLHLTQLPGFSWSTLLERSQSMSLTGSLKKSIDVLCQSWPDTLPPEIVQKSRLLTDSPAETKALRDILSHSNPFRPSPGLRWIPGWPRRIQYLFGKLFPSPAFLRAVHHLPPDASYWRGLWARYASRLSN